MFVSININVDIWMKMRPRHLDKALEAPLLYHAEERS